eukprot:4117305-Pleurochrysis_carterae.AAC.1
MVGHPGPPRRAVRVPAVGRVLHRPRYAGHLRRPDQLRREAGQAVVLFDVPRPPTRHGSHPFRPVATAELRRVRDRKRAAWRSGENRREDVVIPSADRDVDRHGLRAQLPQRAREGRVGPTRACERYQHPRAPRAVPRALRLVVLAAGRLRVVGRCRREYLRATALARAPSLALSRRRAPR